MKTVKARITTTTIFAAVATVENGEIFTEDLPPVTTTARVNESNAAKIFKNESPETIAPGAALLIKSIEKSEKVYEMPVDDFLYYYEVWSNSDGESDNEKV